MPAEKYKTIECKVLAYDKLCNKIDIDFNGYGVRIDCKASDVGSNVIVKYRGEIGKSTFECKV